MIKNWTTVIMSPRFLRLAKFLGSRSAAAGVLVLLQEHGTEVDCRMIFESIADVREVVLVDHPLFCLAGGRGDQGRMGDHARHGRC